MSNFYGLYDEEYLVRYLTWNELKRDDPQMTEWRTITKADMNFIYKQDWWQTVDFRHNFDPEGYFVRCTRSSVKGEKKWFTAVPDELRKHFLYVLYEFDPAIESPWDFYEILYKMENAPN